MVFMGFSTECIRKVERSVNVMPLLQNHTKGFYTKSTAQCKSKESQVGCGLIVPSQGASFDTVVCTSARI